MEKCLITGATGLIGSHLVKQLSADYEVYTMARTSLSESLGGHSIQHFPIDLSQSWDSVVLPEHMDFVVHLAQSEQFRNFPDAALPVFAVNTVSTLKLLDYARRAGVRKFILASTGGIYNAGNQPCSEDVEIVLGRDIGFYIGSKLCSEVLAESYTKYLNVNIFRFFFVYGPGQRSSMLIPRLVQSVKNGTPIILQGKDGLRVNPTHVSDAVSAIHAVLGLDDNHILNIGGPDILSLREIADTIGEIFRRKPVFDVRPDESPRDLIADISKMAAFLGAPKMSFREGVEAYIQYTHQQQPA